MRTSLLLGILPACLLQSDSILAFPARAARRGPFCTLEMAICIHAFVDVMQNQQSFLVELFLVHSAVFRYNKDIQTQKNRGGTAAAVFVFCGVTADKT